MIARLLELLGLITSSRAEHDARIAEHHARMAELAAESIFIGAAKELLDSGSARPQQIIDMFGFDQ